MRKPKSRIHPSLSAMCLELGLDCEEVQRSLEATEARERSQDLNGPVKGTPGSVLLEFAGSWDMSQDEWDEIYKQIKAVREMTE